MERVKTGIKGLDDMLGGGFITETANLVEGAPGTGKTTLVRSLLQQLPDTADVALILDVTGIYKADIGLRDGRIAKIGKAGCFR